MKTKQKKYKKRLNGVKEEKERKRERINKKKEKKWKNMA